MTKVALSIGINDYPGTDSDLAGCVNDAKDWAAALDERRFEVTTVLNAEATREAILTRMRSTIDAAQSGDLVVIVFSGHGTWVPDKDPDEDDLRDEALCPYDVATAGPILDDELFDIFSNRARGVRALLISDSCHSGTLAKFRPVMGDTTDRVKFLAPEVFLADDDRRLAERADAVRRAGRSRRSALLLAGCRDLEYSFDAKFNGRPNGAFTHAALRELRDLPTDATYRDWYDRIRGHLPSADYPQTPQLDGTYDQRRWPIFQSANG